MTEPTDLHVVIVDQLDPRLGRQVVHDPRSRGFAIDSGMVVDRATWVTKSVRLFDPTPNPNQHHGCCTGCAKAMQLNAAGNRKAGRILTEKDADLIYGRATELDPWPGTFPGEDTGSSGLASAKAAQQMGLGGEYRWNFQGADGVVQAIMGGAAVSVGTWWYEGMFHPAPALGVGNVIEPVGRKVGGHQWIARRYNATHDLVGGRCWWGGMRDWWIRRTHLADLLADDGDSHVQVAI